MKISVSVLLTIFLLLPSAIIHAQVYDRTDTLQIPETMNLPLIDGESNDAAWEIVPWQNIAEIWMPYDNDPGNLGQEGGLELWTDSTDFHGQFKAIWSSETNRIYFLVQITDDVFTDGYQYSENPNGGGGYPNYDIVEVFIDEDRSGGLHVFDGTGNFANNWGSNAENALSYHLATYEPEDGSVESVFHALDIAGTSWGYPNQKIADYYEHFEGFAVKKIENQYCWEFSLTVYDDTYDSSNPETSVSQLSVGKIMGLSVAYCDNDNPDESPLRRDHFFGSVYVPEEAYNDHWKQADWFGVAKLIANPSTFSNQFPLQDDVKIRNYTLGKKLKTVVHSPYQGEIKLRITNILGNEIHLKSGNKVSSEWNNTISLEGFKSGIYIVETLHGTTKKATKFVIQ